MAYRRNDHAFIWFEICGVASNRDARKCFADEIFEAVPRLTLDLHRTFDVKESCGAGHLHRVLVTHDPAGFRRSNGLWTDREEVDEIANTDKAIVRNPPTNLQWYTDARVLFTCVVESSLISAILHSTGLHSTLQK